MHHQVKITHFSLWTTIYFSITHHHRLFWIILFVIATYGSVFLLQFVAETYLQNRIAVNLETYNLHWIHTFPAVSLCMMAPSDWFMNPIFYNFVDSYLIEHDMELPDQWVPIKMITASNEHFFYPTSYFIYDPMMFYTFAHAGSRYGVPYQEYCQYNRTCGINPTSAQNTVLILIFHELYL